MMRGWILAASLTVLAGCQADTGSGDDAATEGSAQTANRAMDGVEIEGRIPTDVRRVSIIVRDMEKSLEFYRDALGMEINYDTVVELSGVNLPVGEPGTKARLVLLNGNDPYMGWVGLLHPFEPPLEGSDEPYATRLAPGTAFMVVNTDDAEKACEAAAKIAKASTALYCVQIGTTSYDARCETKIFWTSTT